MKDRIRDVLQECKGWICSWGAGTLGDGQIKAVNEVDDVIKRLDDVIIIDTRATGDLICDSIIASDIKKGLESTCSMSEIADTVDQMDVDMLKLVLKKFIYDRQ